MSDTIHKFQIPHDKVQPTRDMIAIRVPAPPSKVGSILIASAFRDMAQHNILYGLITAKGPVAFAYKDGDGLKVQDAEIGDWVIIRPFAGTMISGGNKGNMLGYRYVSSFNDVIGVIKAADMPKPEEFEWHVSDEDLAKAMTPAAPAPAADFNFTNSRA